MIFGRTEVIIGASKAKNCEESFAEVRLCVSPQKPSKINEKQVFETGKTSRKKNSGIEKSNVGNRLKRVFPKFEAERSYPRGVNGCSKF